jgi:aminoglycoside phosphotransferase (APT) family kinase protein
MRSVPIGVPPGIASVPRLAAWLEANVTDGPVIVTNIELITGGRSNLTYRVTVDAPREQTFVLRRPPLGHVLPTAHDMSREFRVLSGLAGSRVPVARPLALCTDDDILGAPFYVMSFVVGRVLRTLDDAEALNPAQATRLSEDLAGMLATIHGIDLAAAGLADLGRGKGYLRRQLDRWQRQWQLSATREVAGYDTLVERLAAAMPDDGEITLVHGDFRLDNVIVALPGEPGGRPHIAAVVDWEMATLGDPLADLGLTLMYWTEAGEQARLPATVTATAAPGFLTRAGFTAEYARRTGRDVSRIGYYEAFGYFKLAVVAEGINARFLKQQTVGENFDQEGKAVPLLIARAHEVLDSLA